MLVSESQRRLADSGPTLRPAPVGVSAADISIRPLQADDADQLRAMARHVSSESSYFRFFVPMPTLREPLLSHLVNVDHGDREALAAIADGQVVGVARYDRAPADPSTAEIAVLVSDAFQRRGIARRLLLDLAALAQARQIREFTALTLPDNRGIARLLHSLWPQLQVHFDDGNLAYRLPLPPVRQQ